MANRFMLDASALAKRYAAELGTPEMNQLFARSSHDRFAVLTIGMLEVISILVRRRNSGIISSVAFNSAHLNFEHQIVKSAVVARFPMRDSLAFAAIPFISRYSVNATDAILLRSVLDLSNRLRTGGDDIVLVASDRRLLTAANAEGLVTYNPETQTTVELDALVA